MRAMILSGGVAHAFSDTSAALAGILAPLGVHSTVASEVEAALCAPVPADLLVFNLFRDTDFSARYPSDVPDPDYSPSAAARAAILAHLARGGGVLAVHGAVISFADWPEWAAIIGAGWIPRRSGHPRRSPMDVRIVAGAHPVVAGVESYRLADDEAYGFLDLAPDIEGVAFSEHGGVDHPMLWLRSYGGGRVAYLAPCHGLSSLRHPSHRTLIQRTALWLLRRDAELAVPGVPTLPAVPAVPAVPGVPAAPAASPT